MKYKLLNILCGFLVILLAFQCSEPTPDEGFPKDPGHIRVTLTYDSLPGYHLPAQLEFNVEVKGENGNFVVTQDTLRYLTLWYDYNRENIDGTNTWSDTIWSQQVTIGQHIQLNPAFELTRWSEEGGIWYSVWLLYGWSPIRITSRDSVKNNVWGRWGLIFNPIKDSVTVGFNL